MPRRPISRRVGPRADYRGSGVGRVFAEGRV